MINIETFSYALKATWIRLITDNCKWQDYILKYVDLEKMTAVDASIPFVERCFKSFYKD